MNGDHRPTAACFAVICLGFAAACTSTSGAAANPAPCERDDTEANDTRSAATPLGTIQDDDAVVGSDPNAKPKRISKTFSTHTNADIDWYSVDVQDTGIGGNPKLRVIVGDGHEVAAFWACTNGTTKSVTCGLGDPITSDPDTPERGCLSKKGAASPQLTMNIECDGTSTDNGRLELRVRRTDPAPACMTYKLTVSAE